METIKLRPYRFGRGGRLDIGDDSLSIAGPAFRSPLVVPLSQVQGMCGIEYLEPPMLPMVQPIYPRQLAWANLAIVFRRSFPVPELRGRAGRQLGAERIPGVAVRLRDRRHVVPLLEDLGMTYLEDVYEAIAAVDT